MPVQKSNRFIKPDPVDGQASSAIGTLVHHTEIADGVWTIKEGGAEYVLTGAPVQTETLQRCQGVRLVILGTFHKQAPTGNGTLEATALQPLPVGVVSSGQ